MAILKTKYMRRLRRKTFTVPDIFDQKWFLLRWLWNDWWMFLAELSSYMLRFNLISLPHTMIITYFSVSKRARNFEKQPPTPHYSHLSPTHSEYSSPCVLGYSGQTSELLWSQIIGNVQTQCCGRCACCNGWVVVGGSFCFALTFFTRWLRSPRIW